MSQAAAPELVIHSTANLLPVVQFSDEARQLLDGSAGLEASFQALLKKELFADAIRFAAHTLAKRDAVWWAALCGWHVYRPNPDEKIAAALQAAVRWVLEPQEEQRRAADAAARAVGTQTPAGMVALAAFFSGPNIAPAGQKLAVAPGPWLAAKTVAAAVLMLSNQVKHDQVRACRWRFTELAAEVASGQLAFAGGHGAAMVPDKPPGPRA